MRLEALLQQFNIINLLYQLFAQFFNTVPDTITKTSDNFVDHVKSDEL